jgi:hypothetical protein
LVRGNGGVWAAIAVVLGHAAAVALWGRLVEREGVKIGVWNG